MVEPFECVIVVFAYMLVLVILVYLFRKCRPEVEPDEGETPILDRLSGPYVEI